MGLLVMKDTGSGWKRDKREEAKYAKEDKKFEREYQKMVRSESRKLSMAKKMPKKEGLTYAKAMELSKQKKADIEKKNAPYKAAIERSIKAGTHRWYK